MCTVSCAPPAKSKMRVPSVDRVAVDVAFNGVVAIDGDTGDGTRAQWITGPSADRLVAGSRLCVVPSALRSMNGVKMSGRHGRG
jgi:hypothetical protein